MANKITFNNKSPFKLLPDIPIEQKITSDNINEIKETINLNADVLIAQTEEIKNVIESNDDLTLLVDKNKSDIKTLSDKVAKHTGAITFKGPYNAADTYQSGNLVVDEKKEYLSFIDNNKELLTNEEAWVLLGDVGDVDLSNYYNKTQINEALALKQFKLIAGTNVVIAADGKTISATGGGSGGLSQTNKVPIFTGDTFDGKKIYKFSINMMTFQLNNELGIDEVPDILRITGGTITRKRNDGSDFASTFSNTDIGVELYVKANRLKLYIGQVGRYQDGQVGMDITYISNEDA